MLGVRLASGDGYSEGWRRNICGRVVKTRVFAAILLLTTSPALAASYHCERLMAGTLDGVPSFVPSVLGDFTLDGKNRYGHDMGGGEVATDKTGLRVFMSGSMKGTVGRLRKDAKGREYFHIDKAIVEPPQALPRELDVVCYRT